MSESINVTIETTPVEINLTIEPVSAIEVNFRDIAVPDASVMENRLAAAASATAASTSASSASVSATQAAGSATSAETAKTAAETAQTAAEAAESAASTSASSASASASTATTQASNASASATAAASSASAAATSATNAATSETNAGTSATNAANSATSAATSATNATNSAEAVFSSKTTDNLTQGSTNKYFSDALAKTAAIVNSTAGSESDQGPSVSSIKSYIAAQLLTVAGNPTGAVIEYAGTSAPSGYLMCNGQSVSRTTYAALYAAIGTAFGSVDGNSFNVPDKRGNFSRGLVDITTFSGSGSASSNNATFTAHGVNRTGFKVRLSSGTLSGLSGSTDYYAIVVDANTLAFASTYANAIAGTKIAITGANSAVITQWEDPDYASRLQAAVGGNTSGLGTKQEDLFKSHTHTFGWDGSTGGVSTTVGSSTAGGTADGTVTTNATGGTETRPNNIALNYIIKT